MAILKIKKQDGFWAVVGEPSAIKFTEQDLTDEQKKIARENIGAASIIDVIELPTEDVVDTKVATKTSVTVGGLHQETFDADTKLDKTTSPGTYRVYTITNTGSQSTISYGSDNMTAGVIVSRSSAGNIIVPETPGADKNATSKKYVDTNFIKLLPQLGATQILAQQGGGLTTRGYIVSRENSINDNTVPIRTTGGHIYLPNDPTNPNYAANKKYVDDQLSAYLPLTGGIITNDLIINGNLTIKGTTYTEDSETLRIADNLIELNSNKIDFSSVLSGLAINKNDISTYGIMYDPSDDTVKFGEGTSLNGVFSFAENEGAPIAVREDSSKIDDGAIMIFNKSKNRLINSGYTIDSFKQWVRDYIEIYMSTVIEENDNVGETLNINTNNYTEEDGTLTIGG